MCLSTVYEVVDGGENKVCEYVSSVSVGEDSVTLVDIMGLETVVKGRITAVDLVKNTIRISR